MASQCSSAAKLENVLFTKELHRRYHDHGLSAAAFYPGNVATNFGSETRTVVREAGKELGRAQAEAIWQVLSGASHGDFWTTMVLNSDSTLNPIQDTGEDVVEMKVTVPASTQIGLLRVSVTTLRRAYELYDQRRASYL